MSETIPAATSDQETPVYFSAAGESLFGILTRPTHQRAQPSQTGLIFLTGGAPVRNRFSVRLCRTLAARGLYTMRFDYHGVGDSTGSVARFSLSEPFTDDLKACVAWLRTQGVGRILVVGVCFGARTALKVAEEVGQVEGVALIRVPLRDYEKGQRQIVRMATDWTLARTARRAIRPSVFLGLWNRDRRRLYRTFVMTKLRNGSLVNGQRGEPTWPSPALLRSLQNVVQRGVRLLFLYGTEDDHYEDFRTAASNALSRIFAAESASVTVATREGQLKGFTSLETQDWVIKVITEWAEACNRAALRTPAGSNPD